LVTVTMQYQSLFDQLKEHYQYLMLCRFNYSCNC